MKKRDLILSYVIQVLIAIIGTIGIMNTIVTSEFSYMDSKWLLYVVIIIASIVFVTVFNINKHRGYIVAGVIILIAGGAFIWRESITDGFAYIINKFVAYVGDEKGINISAYSMKLGSMSEQMYIQAALAATIMVSVIVACIVSINVTMVRSMLYGILTIVPFMFLMISYNIMPTSGSILFCFVYVMCTSALKRGSSKVMPAIIVMSVTVMVYGLAVLICNGEDYEKPRVFASVNNFIETKFSNTKDWLFKGTGTKDGDVVGDGLLLPSGKELGTLDKVEYKNKSLAFVTTQLTENRQYIPTYYGRTYRYGENIWTNNKNIGENHDVNREFFMMLEGNSTNYKGVASSRAEYDNMVEIYAYTYKAVNSPHTSDLEFGYNVNAAAINRLSNIGTGKYMLPEPNSGRNMTQNYFVRYESSQYGTVKNTWRDIDTNVYRQINNIMDVPDSCKTGEEVLSYVRYVRQYLASNYEYTLEPGKVPEGVDFATYFLTNSKKGYCVHFATSAVLMFRAAGIPARYVEGFVLTPQEIKSGEKSANKDEWYKKVNGLSQAIPTVTNYTVEVKDTASHAWVEIYLMGYGWLPVEVTPAYFGSGVMGTDDTIQGGSQNETNRAEEGSQNETESNVEQESESHSKPETESTTESYIDEEQISVSGMFKGFKNFIKKFWGIMLTVAIGAAIILFVIARYNCRKRRLDKILKGNLIGSYEILEKLLSYTGYRRPDNMTYEMYAEYLKDTEEIFAKYNIVYITEMALKLQLSGDDKAVSKEEQRKLCRNIRAIRKAILEKMPILRRLQIKYFVVL